PTLDNIAGVESLTLRSLLSRLIARTHDGVASFGLRDGLRAIHQQSVVILALADNSLISRYGSSVSVRSDTSLRRSRVDCVPKRQRAVAMLNHKVLHAFCCAQSHCDIVQPFSAGTIKTHNAALPAPTLLPASQVCGNGVRVFAPGVTLSDNHACD